MANNVVSKPQKLALVERPPTTESVTPGTPASSFSAELPNPQRQNTPLTLLNLPSELLERICILVLAHYIDDPDSYDAETGIWERQLLRVANPRYNLADRTKYVDDDYHMPIYTSLSDEQHLGLPRGTLSILQVCIKLHQISYRAFYGLYQFQSYSAESFRLLFTKHIGPSNLKAIRKFSMGLPHGIKTMSSKYISRYTRMLDTEMPQLAEFRVTSKFGRWFTPKTLQPGDTWVENHRGLLWFAAWITRSHPLLKCAVWDEKNTIHDNKLDDERASYYDTRPLIELAVTLSSTKPAKLQIVEDPKLIEARNANVPHPVWVPDDPDNEFGAGYYEQNQYDPETDLPVGVKLVKPACRILLDSWKIRRTGFVGLSSKSTCRPYSYQLRDTAANSEASKPLLGTMSVQEQLEESYFHNKFLEQKVAELTAVDMDIEVLRLRSKISQARSQEGQNIETELLMKRGEPEPDAPEDDFQGGLVATTWNTNPATDDTGGDGDADPTNGPQDLLQGNADYPDLTYESFYLEADEEDPAFYDQYFDDYGPIHNGFFSGEVSAADPQPDVDEHAAMNTSVEASVDDQPLMETEGSLQPPGTRDLESPASSGVSAEQQTSNILPEASQQPSFAELPERSEIAARKTVVDPLAVFRATAGGTALEEGEDWSDIWRDEGADE